MNFEQFFIDKYNALEKENEELKNKLYKYESKMSKNKDTCADAFPLGLSVKNNVQKVIKVLPYTNYDLFRSSYNPKLGKYSYEELLKLLDMDAKEAYQKNLTYIQKETAIGIVYFKDLTHIDSTWINSDLYPIEVKENFNNDEPFSSSYWYFEDNLDTLLNIAWENVKETIEKHMEEMLEVESND